MRRSVLQQGDLLLAIDGETVTSFRDVERAVVDKPEVSMSPSGAARANAILQVPTTALTGIDVDRVVQWAGATLHAPHRAMSAQRGMVPQGVYVAFFSYGSPATRYRLFPGRRIVEVDGQPTPDLDAFLKVVAGRPDRSSLRLRTLTWNNVPGSHHAEAGPPLLADLGDRAYAARLGPARAGIATPSQLALQVPGGLAVRTDRMADGQSGPRSQAELEAAVDALRDGELVAFPTETVYGLGANASNPAAVRKVFELKGRPAFAPGDRPHRPAEVPQALGARAVRRRPRSWPRRSGPAR